MALFQSGQHLLLWAIRQMGHWWKWKVCATEENKPVITETHIRNSVIIPPKLSTPVLSKYPNNSLIAWTWLQNDSWSPERFGSTSCATACLDYCATWKLIAKWKNKSDCKTSQGWKKIQKDWRLQANKKFVALISSSNSFERCHVQLCSQTLKKEVISTLHWDYQ